VTGFGLSPDLVHLQREAREFAVERLRPRAAALEWRPDAADRVAWDLLEEASARGWRTLGLQPGASVLGLCVLVEELSYGDMVLAICFTEPETGSDYILGTTDFRFRTRAQRRPDGRWVLNGEKRFISNGADAGMYLVFACTDETQPAREGTGAFLVEHGTSGLEIAEVHEKISQRTVNNARLRFSDVVLEPERLIGDERRGFAGAGEILKESAIEAGAIALGSARAADVAMRVCLSAAEIHGGVAIMLGASRIEKYVRDCLSYLHSDGAQDSLRLRIADAIRREGPTPRGSGSAAPARGV
jgi:alkylation response protein AidB-like acyl-CoA dehydrogenase